MNPGANGNGRREPTRGRPVTRRVFWASSLSLVAVLLYVISALAQAGQASAPDDPSGTAVAAFWLGTACLLGGIVTLVSAYRARRRLRVRLGMEPPPWASRPPRRPEEPPPGGSSR